MNTLQRMLAIASLALGFFGQMTPGQSAPLDIERLKSIPALDVADHALRGPVARLSVAMPDRFFDTDAEWVAQNARALPAEMAQINAMPPDRRALFWAFWLRGNFGRDGLHSFFFLNGGTYAPEVRAALAALGAEREATILAEAMALFGPEYPRNETTRAERFAWSKPGRRIDEHTTQPNPLNSFDLALMAVSERFGGKRSYDAALEAAIARFPALLALVEEHRAAMTDEQRLDWLRRNLFVSGDRPVAQQIAEWPAPYRAIFILDEAQGEVMNGGVHQYFGNSSGDLAREFVEEARKAGASGPAEAIEKGIAAFAGRYAADRDARSAAMRALAAASPRESDDWSQWDEALNDLTNLFDDGSIPDAQLKIAREAGILPR